MTSYATLITPKTESEVLAELIASLQTAGFSATSWQDGSVPRTLVQLQAVADADFRDIVVSIADGGLLAEADGDWLTLYCESAYGEDRQAAVNTRGACTLTNAATGIPRTIAAFEVWAGTSTGKRFVNITGGTLLPGGTLSLVFEAESPGIAWNVGNDTITTMHTAMAGVTITNPSPGGGASWITTAGAEEEADEAFRTRCQSKWPILGYGMTEEAYSFHAKAASTSTPVTRTLVVRSADWQVSVYVAGTNGAMSGADVVIVDGYLEPRVPLCVDVVAVSAINQNQAVDADLYLEAGYSWDVAALAGYAAMLARFAAHPIGDGTATSVLYRSQLIEDLMGIDGMMNVVLNTPTTDVTPTLYRVLRASPVTFDIYVGGVFAGHYPVV